jgi:D-xylose transport system substrate-binding protein
MTVYKPVRKLAERAAEVAIEMITGKGTPETNRAINNGKIDVPSILLEPITVDTSNMVGTVIADGYHTLEDVYGNVPRSQWPKMKTASGAK